MSALLLTIPEAATQLSLSTRTMWSLVSTGQIRTVLIGSSRRINSAELDRFINTLTTNGDPT